MQNRWLIPFVILFLACLSTAAHAQTIDGTDAGEMKSDVPTLRDFHEVIYPLWHDAWPNKNYDLMRELFPRVQEFMHLLEGEQLPGILRDKQAQWEDNLRELRETVDEYGQSIAEGDDQKLLNAVEHVHAVYEKLVRTIRPLMKELDAYHVVLYKIYHYYMPEKNLDQIRTASKELLEKCAELQNAKLTKRIQAKEKEFKAAVKKLCESSKKLTETAKGKNIKAIEKMVEKVHDDYVAIQALFE